MNVFYWCQRCIAVGGGQLGYPCLPGGSCADGNAVCVLGVCLCHENFFEKNTRCCKLVTNTCTIKTMTHCVEISAEIRSWFVTPVFGACAMGLTNCFPLYDWMQCHFHERERKLERKWFAFQAQESSYRVGKSYRTEITLARWLTVAMLNLLVPKTPPSKNSKENQVAGTKTITGTKMIVFFGEQELIRSSAIAGRPWDAIACQGLLKWTWKWQPRLKWPSNVLQGHQKWHQSKASVWFPISSLS